MSILIITLIVLAIVLTLIGIVGSIVPALPGPPLSWGSLLMAHFACPEYITWTLLWVMLALTILAQVLDYIAPIWMAKVGGGSKAAITGSTVGLILGFFWMPMGWILGPVVGAFVGEMMSSHQLEQALRMALLSFLSFLLSTGFKLALCLAMTYYTLAAGWRMVFN